MPSAVVLCESLSLVLLAVINSIIIHVLPSSKDARERYHLSALAHSSLRYLAAFAMNWT